MGSSREQQRLFFMIKPDGIPQEKTIEQMIAPLAETIACRLFDPVDTSRIENLYAMHRGKAFYNYLVEYFRNKPVKAYLLGRRSDVIYNDGFYPEFLNLVGDTDPAKAKPGTIRSLSTDAMERSVAEGRALRNLVHRSTTADETAREAPLFFADYIFDHTKVEGAQEPFWRFLAEEGEGIFYEERLESGLKKFDLLLPDEQFIRFKVLNARETNSAEGTKALLETLRDGESRVREITPPFGITTSP
jgi:nucleoside diphosphate kinase